MDTMSEWPWSQSLALTRPGQTVQVRRILFETVKKKCDDLNVHQGSILVCDSQDGDGVELTLPSGSEGWLPRHYAWFVCVDPL